MNGEIRFYLAILLRRLPLFALVAGTISAAAIAVSLQLPAKYQSSALLLVESPQIPTDLAASTVRTATGEQLDIMEQRLLTRANLLDIADEFDVFAGRMGRPHPPGGAGVDPVVLDQFIEDTAGIFVELGRFHAPFRGNHCG